MCNNRAIVSDRSDNHVTYIKTIRCVARHIKNLIKEDIKSLYWLKSLIVSDVSATTVAFLSKDKNANVKRRPVK